MQIRFKFLSTVFTFFAFTAMAQAAELPFTDVEGTHFEAIYKMKEWGVFEGYNDGSFRPFGEITRAELAKAIVLGAGVEKSELDACASKATKLFTDLVDESWYMDYVYCAQAKGWIDGDDGKKTFRPGDPALLHEALKMIVESQVEVLNESLSGHRWYDIYTNILADASIIEGSEDFWFYTYIEDAYESKIGFDSDVYTKVLRKDIAELMYRVGTMVESGGENLAIYNPLLSVDEYREKYDSSIEETTEGVLKISDPYFGFEAENVYIGKFNLADLRILIQNPSAFQNGDATVLMLMYPSLQTKFYRTDTNFQELFSFEINDSSSIQAHCRSYYSRPFDLWEIYDALCGETGENYHLLNSLLQLRPYGDAYTGEVLELNPAGNGPLSILKYNDVMEDAARMAYINENGDGKYVDYLETLRDLISEEADQEAELQAWLEAFIHSFDISEDEIVANYEALPALIIKYEKKFLEGFGETLTFTVQLESSYYIDDDSDYINYSADQYEQYPNDEYGIFSSMNILLGEESDPLNGLYFENAYQTNYLEEILLKVTVKSPPIEFSEVYSSDEVIKMNHIAIWQPPLMYSYYYEILSIEIVN